MDKEMVNKDRAVSMLTHAKYDRRSREGTKASAYSTQLISF